MAVKKSGSRHKAHFIISGPVEILSTGTYSGPLRDVQEGIAGDWKPRRPSRSDSAPRKFGTVRRKSSLARAHAHQYKHLYPRFDATTSTPNSRRGSASRSGPQLKALPEKSRNDSNCNITDAMAEMKLDLEKWVGLGVQTEGMRLTMNMFDVEESPIDPYGPAHADAVSFGDYRIQPTVNSGYDANDDEVDMLCPITPRLPPGKHSTPPAIPASYIEGETQPREGKPSVVDEFDEDQVELIKAIASELKIEPPEKSPATPLATNPHRSSSIYSRAESWVSFYSDESNETATPGTSVSGESVKINSEKIKEEESQEVQQDQELAAMVWQALWAYKKPIGAAMDQRVQAHYIFAPHEQVVSQPPAKGMPPPHLHPAWPLRHSSKRVEMTMI